MARAKRLRMIAGPNGSGKSELFKNLALERSPSGVFHGGPFVNADELEEQWRTARAIDLAPFPITSSTEELRAWMRGSPWAGRVSRLVEKIEFQSDALRMPPHAAHSYFAAALADYLREKLIAAGRSFSFETVMSHESKVNILTRARSRGYRTYLYFVATDDPELNVQRVRVRALAGGHAVPRKKIVERFARSLALLPAAIRESDRAYLFDNSGPNHVLLAEFASGKMWNRHLPEKSEPEWFRRLLRSMGHL